MSRADFDLNLGVLALRNGFVDEAGLAAALRVWAGETRPLVEILEQSGSITPERRALLVALTEQRVRPRSTEPEPEPELGSTPKPKSKPRPPDDNPLAMTVSAAPEEVEADGAEGGDEPSGLAGPRGRFRVLRPHAKGGLGVVFVALDAELRREVALKEIKPSHADHPESRLRFVLEAEITGGLEHPGIVPVYSLGHDGAGRPFYAMRFIQGESLKDAIDHFHRAEGADRDPGERALELQKLLRRFLDVCNAIAYAHSRGVLHRDIKPGNVMVGPFGETLVVDWGLAKVLGEADGDDPTATRRPFAEIEAEAEAAHLTRTGSALGTPQYMSPEQAAGELDQLGPASDVYSLGATLYCLLTGQPPFPSGAPAEINARVRSGSFPAPREIMPPIPRALEAVCLKAMALQPGDRYATPRDLADDIQRFLADEPVSALREPWTARARRWARRHRAVVSSLAAALLVALLGLSAGLLILDQARRREGRLNRALQTANVELAATLQRVKTANAAADRRLDQTMEAIEDYYTGVSREVLLSQKEFQSLRARLLEKPLAFYQKMTRELELAPADDQRSRFLLARGRLELGKILFPLGRKEEARDQWRAAVALFEPLTALAPDDPSYHEELAACHANLGSVLAELGDHPQSIVEFRKAIAMLDAPPPPREPGFDVYQPLVRASAYWGLGTELALTGDSAGGLAALRRSAELAEALARDHPDTADALNAQARAHASLGVQLAATSDASEAVAELRRAVEAFQTMVETLPNGADFRESLAGSYSNLGGQLQRMGDAEGAVAAHRRAMEIAEAVAAAEPNAPDHATRLAMSRRGLADALRRRGDNPGSVALLRQAIAALEQLATAHPEIPDIRHQLAQTRGDLGELLELTGDLDGAETQRRDAIRGLDALVAEQPGVVEYRGALAIAHNHIGASLTRRGDLKGAEREYRRSVALYEALIADHPELPDLQQGLVATSLNLVEIVAGTGDAKAAVETIARTIERAEALVKSHPDMLRYRATLAAARRGEATARIRAGDLAGARRAGETALTIYRELLAAEPNEPARRYAMAGLHGTLGAVAAMTGAAAEAIKEGELSAEAFEALVKTHPEVILYRHELARSLMKLGITRAQTGNPGKGLADCREAVALCEAVVAEAPEAPDYRQTLAGGRMATGMILEGLGRDREALAEFEAAAPHVRIVWAAAPGSIEYRGLMGAWSMKIARLLRVAGRVAESAAATRERLPICADMPVELYNAACELALCAAAKADGAEALEAEAVAALRSAVAAGWTDAAHAAADPDLAPLRDRDDFRALLDLMRLPPLPANPFAGP